MTIRRPKASVVIDAYETKTCKSIKVIKKANEKGSTVVESDSSIRKWKVSEVTTPVATEMDRFSLKILSENSNNKSHGSLNETFEKNIHFNFQNSFTSSFIESRSKKMSISAIPIFKNISPIKCEPVTEKRIIHVINETPNDDTQEEIALTSDNVKSTLDSQITEEKINVINETREFNSIENSLIQMSRIPQIIPEEKSMEILEDIDDVQLSSSDDGDNESPKIENLKIGRQAKLTAKENISKQCYQVNGFRLPVDIDATQISESPEIIIPKTPVKKSQILKRPSPSIVESIGHQSKLCDTSKAYLHSQDSSLISSPIEQDKSKLTCQLPGRNSTTVAISSSTKPLEKKTDKVTSKPTDNEVPIQKKQFFKSSFCERRRQEMERFSNLINSKPIKESEKPSIKIKKSTNNQTSKKVEKTQKPRKPKVAKKKAGNKRKPKESPNEIIFSGNSDKSQIDKITIADSENVKYDQPIEKARGLDNSSEDLFSFTPQFVQKRKLKTLKTKTKPKNKRLSACSYVYDVSSDISSPPKRQNAISYRSKSKSMSFGEKIPGPESIGEMLINFESDINRIKGIHQSMTYHAINQCLSPYHDRYWRLYIHESNTFGKWSTHLCGSVQNQHQLQKNTPIGSLKNGRNFYCHCSMFVKKYYPDWDFHSFHNGCRWILSLKDQSRKHTFNCKSRNGYFSFEKFWIETGKWLLNMDKYTLTGLGICGMMYTRNKLSIWMIDQDNFDANIEVGILWRSSLNLLHSPDFTFELKALKKPKILTIL